MSEFTCGACPCFQDTNLGKLVKQGLLKEGETLCDVKYVAVASVDEACILRRLMISLEEEVEYFRKADEEILKALGDDALADADELGLRWVYETAAYDIKRLRAERTRYKKVLESLLHDAEGMIRSDPEENWQFMKLSHVIKVCREALKPPCTECNGFGEIYDEHGTGVAPYPCPKCKPKTEKRVAPEVVAKALGAEHIGEVPTKYGISPLVPALKFWRMADRYREALKKANKTIDALMDEYAEYVHKHGDSFGNHLPAVQLACETYDARQSLNPPEEMRCEKCRVVKPCACDWAEEQKEKKVEK